jgi:uncharacterized protein (DUF486 family)
MPTRQLRPNENDRPAYHFERIHESRLVRAFEVQGSTALACHSGELGRRVPANRIGLNQWSVVQLKVLQECITLFVFTIIAFALFGSTVRWNHLVSYALLIGAAYFTFKFP